MTNRLTMLILALVVTTGCAGTTYKQKVSAGHQTVRTALVAVDDLEKQLCAPAPAQVNRCTSPGAAAIGLTDAKHQEISRSIAKALETDIKVAEAIIAWKSGEPMPADLPSLLQVANDTLIAIQPLARGQLYDKAQALLQRVVDLAGLFVKE